MNGSFCAAGKRRSQRAGIFCGTAAQEATKKRLERQSQKKSSGLVARRAIAALGAIRLRPSIRLCPFSNWYDVPSGSSTSYLPTGHMRIVRSR